MIHSFNLNLRDSYILIIHKLLSKILRLWLEPFYNKETGPDDSQLLQTANALAITLEMDDTVIYQGLQ